MKTNTFKYFGLALMAILMVSFTSCEVEIDSFYDDDNNGAGYYNRSADLCSRTWVSFYRDMDGNYCRQELDFFLDRTDARLRCSVDWRFLSQGRCMRAFWRKAVLN
jgi:hypothetical protein